MKRTPMINAASSARDSVVPTRAIFGGHTARSADVFALR
jgi:hypothetical protein